MPALHSCPRCTQVLPASAVFCRRCGAVVEMPVSTARSPVNKTTSFFSSLLAVLFCVAMVLIGLVLFRVQAQPTSVQMNAPAYSPPPVQPAYPPTIREQVYPPVMVPQVYPERDGNNERYYERRDDGRFPHR